MQDNFYNQIKNIALKFSEDKIFIIGKGSSIDRINLESIKNSLIININDSEAIIPGEICLFNKEWVPERLSESGFLCSLYLSPFKLKDQVNNICCKIHNLNQDSADLIYKRFNEEGFELESVLFLSALKVAKTIATIKGKKQKVFMLGFDFYSDQKFSREIDRDFSDNSEQFRSFIISQQEYIFNNFRSVMEINEIDIFHVGEKDYSDISTKNFDNVVFEKSYTSFIDHNSTKKLKQNYEEKISGDGVLITAELTTNHFGDMDLLEKMVDRSVFSGADLIKIQKRDVESFYSAEELNSQYISPFGNTFRDYRNQLELSKDQIKQFDEICRSHGIPWFVSILDEPSLEFMFDFELDVIKLPSTISEHKAFLKKVSSCYFDDIVISTGMTSSDYENFILKTFAKNRRIFLLQCNSSYPTPPEDCNISVINHYKSLSNIHSNIIPGYSSHDIGSLASCLSVAAGARMIEKHVKLGSHDWAHFDSVALDLAKHEFSDYVRDLRNTEVLLGSPDKKINDSEHHKYWKK